MGKVGSLVAHVPVDARGAHCIYSCSCLLVRLQQRAACWSLPDHGASHVSALCSVSKLIRQQSGRRLPHQIVGRRLGRSLSDRTIASRPAAEPRLVGREVHLLLALRASLKKRPGCSRPCSQVRIVPTEDLLGLLLRVRLEHLLVADATDCALRVTGEQLIHSSRSWLAFS